MMSNQTNLNQSGVGVVIKFHSRNDSGQIIRELSPLRYAIERNNVVQILHYLGLITNILSIVVLSQKRMLSQRKSLIYLIFLSLSDFLYNLLSELPNFIMVLRLVDQGYDIFRKSDLGCFFYDYRTSSFHFFSVLLTLFVTIDRFYHIYKPLVKLNRKYSSRRYKLFICFILWFLAFLVALPHAFLMVYDPEQNDCNGRSIFLRPVSKSSQLTVYQVYFTFVEPVLIWFIPGILILFLNAYVIYKIIKSNRDRQNNQLLKKSRQQKLNSSLGSAQAQPRERINLLQKEHDIKVVVSEEQIDENFPHQITVSTPSSLCNSKTNIKGLNKSQVLNTPQNEMNSLTVIERKRSVKSNSSHQSSSQHHNTPHSTSVKNKIGMNQISHYTTIIMLGFFFILSTIPYAITLSLMNNHTLRLNYALASKEAYLNDPLWKQYGWLRDWVAVFKLFFTSNHCLNFFFYLTFNPLFRGTFLNIFVLSFVRLFKKNRT